MQRNLSSSRNFVIVEIAVICEICCVLVGKSVFWSWPIFKVLQLFVHIVQLFEWSSFFSNVANHVWWFHTLWAKIVRLKKKQSSTNGSRKWETISESTEAVECNVSGLRHPTYEGRFKSHCHAFVTPVLI